MRKTRTPWLSGLIVGLIGVLAAAGCYQLPTNPPNPGPAPSSQSPAPEKDGEACKSYEDSLTGGQVFTMYCSYCHNAPTLAERPFASYQNVAAHTARPREPDRQRVRQAAGLFAPLARRARAAARRRLVAEAGHLLPTDSRAEG